MSDKQKLLRIAAVVLLVAAAVLWIKASLEKQVAVGIAAVRERIAIDTRNDSYMWGGADLIVYSDDHSTQKVRIIGESGSIDATGVITADAGIVMTGNLSDENGSFRVNDNALVTGTLGVSSQINAAGGVAATGNVTVSTDLSVAGNILSAAASVRINDPVIITGGLTVQGVVADNGTSVRIQDPVLITGSLGVTAQVSADGLASTNAITSSGSLSVTNWGRFYGLGFDSYSSQVVTASYGITPGNYSMIYLADDGGQATGTIDLDGTVSIVAGSRIGQILVIVWNDSAGAELEIDDASNVQIPDDKDLQCGYLEGAVFLWHGTDWVYLGGCELAAAD